MEIAETVIFATPIYTTILDDVVNNSCLKDECLYVQSKNSGRKISNYGGWQSKPIIGDDLHKVKHIKNLTEQSMLILKEILNVWEIKKNPVFGGCWININKKHNFNVPHVHPKSFFSCVYYVKANKSSGNLCFTRQDPQEHYIQEFHNNFTYKTYEIVPEDKKIVFFPAYLNHFVYPNESEEDRISIAMNFSLGDLPT
jgi:uncharacterized protein (TIGR02466 family)